MNLIGKIIGEVAEDQLQKDLEAMQGLKIQYEKEIKHLRKQITGQEDLIYRSGKMNDLMNLIKRLSGVDSTVLIQGESGVGKELVAASIIVGIEVDHTYIAFSINICHCHAIRTHQGMIPTQRERYCACFSDFTHAFADFFMG